MQYRHNGRDGISVARTRPQQEVAKQQRRRRACCYITSVSQPAASAAAAAAAAAATAGSSARLAYTYGSCWCILTESAVPGPGHRRAARLAPPRLLGSSSYARASVGRSNRRTSAPSAASCLSGNHRQRHLPPSKKGKSSPYSITERRVPELIPVPGSQPAGDMSHKPDC